MSLLDKLKKFDKNIPVKEISIISKEIKKKNLNPPPIVPKKVKEVKVKPLIKDQNKFKIDWMKVASSSDFKRAVYLVLEGKSWRGTNKNLDKELNKKIEVYRDPNFYSAVKEMKNMFKNGIMKPSDIIKEQEKIENEENNSMADI